MWPAPSGDAVISAPLHSPFPLCPCPTCALGPRCTHRGEHRAVSSLALVAWDWALKVTVRWGTQGDRCGLQGINREGQPTRSPSLASPHKEPCPLPLPLPPSHASGNGPCAEATNPAGFFLFCPLSFCPTTFWAK